MRIFEILLLILLLFSAGGTLLIKNEKYKLILPAASVMFSFMSIFAEGFRFAMTPAYILSVILFAFCFTKLFFKAEKRHPILKGFAIAGFCLVYTISIALPAFLPVVNLSKPSGSNLVGTMKLDFTEAARKNIVTGKASSQKIAVQVWYPASNVNGCKRANWMDSRRLASYFAEYERFPDLFGQLTLIKTNSYWNAAISNKSENYPVILFSGGAGMFNAQNTTQMEELASQGYVVFAVSHPYDDFAVMYTDGSAVPFSEKQSSALSKDSGEAIKVAKKQVTDEKSAEFQRTLIRNCKLNTENVRVWSDDMSFAADEISRLNDGSTQSIFKGKLDMSRLGIFGHSFGGAAAGEACLRDSRFKAFINLDGTPFGDSVDRVIEQPFMLLTSGYGSSSKLKPSEGYSKDQKNFMVVSINGAEHMNFSDIGTVIPNVGKALGALGKINANRQTEIMNKCIISFFNKHLKGTQEAVLNDSLSKYPEVTVEKK